VWEGKYGEDGRKVARKGKGGIGPLVWEVDNIDEARDYVLAKGYQIKFEYHEGGVSQIILDPDQFFGYLITSCSAPSDRVHSTPSMARGTTRIHLWLQRSTQSLRHDWSGGGGGKPFSLVSFETHTSRPGVRRDTESDRSAGSAG
jgi:hypothetical protein